MNDQKELKDKVDESITETKVQSHSPWILSIAFSC